MGMPRPRGARGPSAAVSFRTRLVFMALLTLLASRASSEGGGGGGGGGGDGGGVDGGGGEAGALSGGDGRRDRGDSRRPERVHGDHDDDGGGGSLLVMHGGDRGPAGAHNRTSRPRNDADHAPRHGSALRRRLASPPETREQDGVTYIRCRNRANAYSAAWLAPKDTFLKTPYADRLTLEWHSFNIYNQAKGSGYKTEAKTDFYVVHLSAYEHSHANQKTHLLTESGLTKVKANADIEHEMACGVGNYSFEPRDRVRMRAQTRVLILPALRRAAPRLAPWPRHPSHTSHTSHRSLTHVSSACLLAGDRDSAVLLGCRGKRLANGQRALDLAGASEAEMGSEHHLLDAAVDGPRAGGHVHGG